MITAEEVHEQMVANEHKVSVALNVFRVKTLDEVKTTINALTRLSKQTHETVGSAGITAHYHKGDIKITYDY